jgi:acetyl esterase/lipase
MNPLGVPLLLVAFTAPLVFAQSAPNPPPKPALPVPKPGVAEEKKPEYVPPTPTSADVAYGPHPKQVLNFWKADADKPTPLIFHIHGGGWMGGNRNSGLAAILPEALKAGISVVSVEYRFIPEATADGVVPPVKGPMGDAARALQFVRSKAAEWNLDKGRIGASGGSAGACSSLWLAFHEDMADPKSEDLVARESTRLQCAAVTGPQTSLDPKQMREWTPNSRYGGHAFGVTTAPGSKQPSFDLFYESRDKLLPWIKEYSPYEQVSAGDPPVGLYFNNAPALGAPAEDPTHSANFGVKLKERCDEMKVSCELVYPGSTGVQHQTPMDFLKSVLKPSPQG